MAPSRSGCSVAGGWAFLLFLTSAIGIRIWLSGLGPTLIVDMAFDDSLYIDQARHISAGEWLGPYDCRRLAKGPGFAVFLAGAHGLGIPWLLAQDLLACVAGLVLYAALRAHGIGVLPSSLGFLGVVLAPTAFGDMADRVLREEVYSSQIVLLLAMGARWAAPRPLRRRGLQAFGFGVVLGWYWSTREEGPWILPALTLLGVLALRAEAVRHPQAGGRSSILFASRRLAGPALAASLGHAAVVGALLIANATSYGVWRLTEQSSPEFRAALGAFSRFDADPWRPLQPVGPALLDRLYPECPTLAALRPTIEGPLHRGHFAEDGSGGRLFVYFGWMLREAVEIAGLSPDAKAAARTWSRIAAEVNAAADRGIRPAIGARSGPLPYIHPDGWGPMLRTVPGLLADVASLRLPPGAPIPRLPGTQGDLAGAAAIRRFLHESAEPRAPGDHTERIRAVRRLRTAWSGVIPIAAAAGISGAFVAAFRRGRRPSAGCGVLAAVVLAVLSRVLLVAFLLTWFYPFGHHYLVPVVPLVPLVAVLGLRAGLLAFRTRAGGPAPTRALPVLAVVLVGSTAWAAWQPGADDPAKVARSPLEVESGPWRLHALVEGCELESASDGRPRIRLIGDAGCLQLHVENRWLPGRWDLELAVGFEPGLADRHWAVAWFAGDMAYNFWGLAPGFRDGVRLLELAGGGEGSGVRLFGDPGPGQQVTRIPVGAPHITTIFLVPPSDGSRMTLHGIRPVPAGG